LNVTATQNVTHLEADFAFGNLQTAASKALNSGSYTFEADESGWRLTSINECQQHSWDEVQMLKNSPNTIYLMTHCGACTLPKEAFAAEQLQQLVVWCGMEKEEEF